MIFNKANLTVAKVASQHEHDRGLNCVHLNPDGSSVAANGKVIMAVGPVDEDKAHFPDVGEQTAPGPNGVSIPLDLVEKAMRNIPKGQAKLQNIAMTINADPRKVELTTSDMRLQQRVAGAPHQDPFPNWKKTFRDGRGAFRLCLNRRSLIDLLTAFEDACPDKGDQTPIYLEINEAATGMVARCVNMETGQRVIGAMSAYNTQGHWLPVDVWEQSVFNIQIKSLKGSHSIPPAV